jgi:adenine-specific DNA methylase
MDQPDYGRNRRLIEEWLPIAELSEESVRERRSMTALPPTYYLHVWFARRPLVASRAAVLASLLPADADRATLSRTPASPRPPSKPPTCSTTRP